MSAGAVGIITLNRPKALNALYDALIAELGKALDELRSRPADPRHRHHRQREGVRRRRRHQGDEGPRLRRVYSSDFITRGWERLAQCRKPVIAAVAGFALGGGCELAMMCDIIIAADNAKFGQPEINLGMMPGAGGTQRLTRAIGKAKAMEMCLTGRMMDAAEAERRAWSPASCRLADLLAEAMKMAEKIAAMSLADRR